MSDREFQPDTSQDWEKLDGMTAFMLIERHAEDWGQTGHMMESWLRARSNALAAAAQPVAVFGGYLDGGAAVIQWRGKGLPAGTLLYAEPVAK